MVIERVLPVIEHNEANSCYGDSVYVDRHNPDRAIRYWKSEPFNKGLFKKGCVPPTLLSFVEEIYAQNIGYSRKN